jgi:hypothetical protein
MSKTPKKAKPGRWADQHRLNYEFAKQAILERGEAVSMFVIHGVDKILILPALWENEADKQKMALNVRLVVVAEDASCVAFLTEAWIRVVSQAHGETEAELYRRAKAVTPEKAEDRIEVVIVTTDFRDPSGELQSLSTMGEIVRRDDGKPSAVTERPIPGTLAIEGRFFDLVPPIRPTLEQREAARRVLECFGISYRGLPS